MTRTKLYIDIDGVLLKYTGNNVPKDINKFIRFIVTNFDCYWLTTHCKGNAQTAIDYLSEYLSADDLSYYRILKLQIGIH